MDFRLSLDISAYSLIALARGAMPLMERRGGGSIVTLTYLGSERVFPNYNVMGVAKAALEATVRYLAADLGSKNIRVNAISAGPIKTLAASGIGGFSSILQVYRDRAPLRRTVDTSEVADAAMFLLGPRRPRGHRRSAHGRRRISRHGHVACNFRGPGGSDGNAEILNTRGDARRRADGAADPCRLRQLRQQHDRRCDDHDAGEDLVRERSDRRRRSASTSRRSKGW